jgi:hypothetical protein
MPNENPILKTQRMFFATLAMLALVAGSSTNKNVKP